MIAASDADDVGDEPLLIHRRTLAPVWVGRHRDRAALALCRENPQVDVLISDDGLQHHALHRDLQLLVFGERGVGNAHLLPAGPLREPLTQRLAGLSSGPRPVSDRHRTRRSKTPAPSPNTWIAYSAGVRSTRLPGAVCERHLDRLVPLRDWHAGLRARAEAVASWAGRTVHAAAGIAHPQAFFRMLADLGLRVMEHPMADHAVPWPRPWPAGASPVIVTEKDAVKIAPESADAEDIWVATLDLRIPSDLLDSIEQALRSLRHPRSC